jgi:hypothetical protein
MTPNIGLRTMTPTGVPNSVWATGAMTNLLGAAAGEVEAAKICRR